MILCRQCQSGVRATYATTPGRYTCIAVNRIQYANGQQQPLVRTKLLEDRSHGIGTDILGTLIAVASHIDRPIEHWFSYHKAENSWFRNSDSLPIARNVNHPFQSNDPNETADVLFFENQ